MAVASSFVMRDSSPNKMSKLPSAAEDNMSTESARRSFVLQGLTLSSAILAGGAIDVEHSEAAVGSLPEFAGTNAILQGLTVNVADQSQQKSMIEFMTQGFGFEILRQRINGPIEETVR